MNFIRLISTEDKIFAEAIKLYKESFPKHEQREDISQKEILKCKEYHFDLIYDKNLFIGIILYWETQDFLYVEHFCIGSKIRNQRYGQRALELLKEKEKTIILEIDPPIDEISIRRKSFYERVGYKENSFKHIHPPYHKENKAHSLVIMSYPNLLSQTAYNKFDLYLKNKVMGE